MTILTVSQLQEHVETDLGSDAIQRLADAAEKAIDAEAGATAAKTDPFNAWGYGAGRDRVLYTTSAISAISSIVERDYPDGDPTTLASDDYRQEGSRALVRLQQGTNPRALWAPHVLVTYTPLADAELRTMVQINLVKLWITYSGAQREKMGDAEFWHHDTGKEFRAVLAPLRNGRNQWPMR